MYSGEIMKYTDEALSGVVIINKGETEYSGNADLFIRDSIGKVFSEVMKEVRG